VKKEKDPRSLPKPFAIARPTEEKTGKREREKKCFAIAAINLTFTKKNTTRTLRTKPRHRKKNSIITMSEEKECRPNPTTMEGMIWNANHVLEKALSPHINGMPKRLFKECVGVVMMHSVQMGFILSGTTATGILLKK
jgi:hypothetical protein